MHIISSIPEITSILLSARKMKAEYIHFLPPNIVFIMSGNREDYIFAKTALVIQESAAVPLNTYNNMYLYIKNAKKAQKNPSSVFHKVGLKSVTITPTCLTFNNSRKLALKVILPVHPIKFTNEIQIISTIDSSFMEQAPHLTISRSQLNWIHLLLVERKQKYRDKVRNSTDNAIRIESGQIVLYAMVDDKIEKIETYTTVDRKTPFLSDQPYIFSDRALYFFKWMMATTNFEEVTIISRPDHTIIEGDSANLQLKVRAGKDRGLELV